jgi:hypothetical protein
MRYCIFKVWSIPIYREILEMLFLPLRSPMDALTWDIENQCGLFAPLRARVSLPLTTHVEIIETHDQAG